VLCEPLKFTTSVVTGPDTAVALPPIANPYFEAAALTLPAKARM
jgi:hypothetical protein